MTQVLAAVTYHWTPELTWPPVDNGYSRGPTTCCSEMDTLLSLMAESEFQPMSQAYTLSGSNVLLRGSNFFFFFASMGKDRYTHLPVKIPKLENSTSKSEYLDGG